MKVLISFILLLCFLHANYEKLYDECKNKNINSCDKLKNDLEKNCLKKEGKFCAVLAQIYEKGLGNIEKNFKKSEILYKKSCENGIASSCHFLGDMAYFGKGISQDFNRAFKLYNLACQNGFYKSCVNLGKMYEDGDGVEKNVTKAFYIYKNSCKDGDKISCLSIAQMVTDGKISKEEVEARLYFD